MVVHAPSRLFCPPIEWFHSDQVTCRYIPVLPGVWWRAKCRQVLSLLHTAAYMYWIHLWHRHKHLLTDTAAKLLHWLQRVGGESWRWIDIHQDSSYRSVSRSRWGAKIVQVMETCNSSGQNVWENSRCEYILIKSQTLLLSWMLK